MPEPGSSHRGWCGTPQANTVLWNEDGTQLCLPSQPLGLSVVEFNGYLREPPGWYRRHTTPVTIDGVHARRWNSGTVQREPRSAAHLLQTAASPSTVLSPEPGAAQQILASVRIVSVDQHGCPTHPTPLFRRGSRRRASSRSCRGEPSASSGARTRAAGSTSRTAWGARPQSASPARSTQAPFGFSHRTAPHHPQVDLRPDLAGIAHRRPPSVRGRTTVQARCRPPHRLLQLGASNGRSGVHAPAALGERRSRETRRYFGALTVIPR